MLDYFPIKIYNNIIDTFRMLYYIKKSKNDPLELVILIASFYGLRRSEVLGLK